MRCRIAIAVLLMLGMCWAACAAEEPPVQVAAYYFPNWHRKPGEKGDAFGEWGNVQRAVPRFPGHEQPKVPLWGYQDEADPAVMAQKIDAAAENGVSSFIFCWYYHEQGPMLEEALTQGYLRAPNRRRTPFALMWANHDVGPDRKGAVSRQVFDRIADRLVSDYFTQKSYWRVNGRCYFSIYEIDTFIRGMGGVEQARAALDDLRRKAKAAGCGDIHLNIVDWQVNRHADAAELLRKLGADSSTSYVWVHHIALRDFPSTDYLKVRDAYLKLWDDRLSKLGVPHFPNVMMGWDPTPRLLPTQKHTGRGYPDTPVAVGNTPAQFAAALREAKKRAMTLPAGERIVTVYAWNEWSEGGYLEPDTVHKMAYLKAIRDVFGAPADGNR